MHIQPMEQQVTITKSAKSSVNKGSSMSYAYNNFDITRSLEEIKQQNDVKNKFLLAITGLLTLGTILIPASIYLKGGGGSKSSTQSIYGLVRNFENLSKNEKIPTLATCKSINKKLKSFLQEQINYVKANQNDIIKAGNPKPTNMLLMYGPPGTGKTFFSKIFAKTLGAEYTEIKFADFNSQWCGEHIENLKSVMNDILATATLSPQKKFVVTFNEIDAILQPVENMSNVKGGYGMVKAEERATILTYIDEILEKAPNVTIIGTTNLAPKNNQLDGAAMSRFKNIIEVSYPDKECLYEALKTLLERIDNGKDFIENNKNMIKKLTEKLNQRKASFRDLDNIAEKAKKAYLEACMTNKNAKFKYQYLDDALNNLDLTDGERNFSGKLDCCA